jgi:hypothetical protein
MSDGQILHRIVAGPKISAMHKYTIDHEACASTPWSLRITRPLELGTAEDRHHLHLASLAVCDTACSRVAPSEVQRWAEFEVLAPFASPTAIVANLQQKQSPALVSKWNKSFVEIKVRSADLDGHVLQRFDVVDEELLCMMKVDLQAEMATFLLLMRRIRQKNSLPVHISRQILDFATPLCQFFKARKLAFLKVEEQLQLKLIR